MIAITGRFRKPPQGVRIGRVKGIDIKVHWSWLIAFFLVYYAVYQFFVANLESTDVVYAVHSLIVTICFFMSVTLHELTHSLVARRRGVPVKEITLFIFGGIAWMGREADSPSVEIRVASAGPLFSFSAFVAFTGLALLSSWRGWGAPSLTFTILAMINFGLTFFNLLPAFPLDGGRVLRAWLWKRWGDPVRSTVLASRIGQGVGIALTAVGIGSLFVDLQRSGYDRVATALWLIFIGVFLYQLAREGGHRSVAQMRLTATQVSQAMRAWEGLGEVISPPSGTRDRWEMAPRNLESESSGTIDGDANLLQALRKMENEGRTFLLVEAGGEKVGIIRKEDIMEYLRREKT